MTSTTTTQPDTERDEQQAKRDRRIELAHGNRAASPAKKARRKATTVARRKNRSRA